MGSPEHQHSHGNGVRLDPEAHSILVEGLKELLSRADGMEVRELHSEKYPLPLHHAVYRLGASIETIRRDIEARLDSDPVSVLENALALLEIYESNQPDVDDYILEDMPFKSACFMSKRRSGWLAILGNGDREQLTAAVNAKWQFEDFSGPERETNVYLLLNMLARYAYVFGRIQSGDAHGMSHFIEDFCPGVIICHGDLTPLESALSLAAMKLGVPAVVPSSYPFPLGRTAKADSLDDIPDAIVSFPNVRRLLQHPDLPPLPDYCSVEHRGEKFESVRTWGDTPESFFFVKKGAVDEPGTDIVGVPTGPIGILVTIDAEPMDAFDCQYIEGRIAGCLSLIKGIKVNAANGEYAIHFDEGAELGPEQIGEVLIAATRQEFPKLKNIRIRIVFDPPELAALSEKVSGWRQERRDTIDSATEENIDSFCVCVGCSPFAPDHVCVLTPERPPQCARPYGMIKTGALYAYDDMSNIHHRTAHEHINSFGVVEPGRCLDPVSGEWEGVNAKVKELSGGRVERVQLHSLDDTPHTGCGCFRFIMFQMDKPKSGIGIMDSRFLGAAPDGRQWKDLHYALGGKQTQGMAGATFAYLHSKKFLGTHGGWDSVVWVAPKIAQSMGDKLPTHVEVGEDQAA